MEFLCHDGPPRRYVCASRDTYKEIWPYLFSRHVPAARLFARWVARNGAGVHCALKLRLHKGRGCCLVSTRCVPAGRVLASIPLALSLSTGPRDMRGGFDYRWDSVEELSGVVVRELHNPSGFHRLYLELLHDVYNEDEADMPARHNSLQEELDNMYMGNSMHVKGVPNAPFIPKSDLLSVSQRVDWVCLRSLLRRMQQSLPHFASVSASWGLSMVLSRALRDDCGGLTLYPIIDFCLHSFEPNSMIRLTHPGCVEDRGIGLGWHDVAQPCVHLIAQRAMEAGEAVTLLYSQRRVASMEDAEYWKLRWGYVPG